MRGALLLLAVASCRTDATPTSPTTPAVANEQPETTGFAIDKAAQRRAGVPDELIDKLTASRYRYFRFVAQPFSRRVCEAFADERWNMPAVVVHGDAHLEQFAYTDRVHGLEDFDRAGLGPAVVDLVRFGSSIHVACRELSWKCDAQRAVEVLVDAYRHGIDRPREPAAAPSVIARLRAERVSDKAVFADWAQALMKPLDADLERRVLDRHAEFTAFMLQIDGTRGREFFAPVAVGGLDIGVGSALDLKFLLRIRGPSDDPLDDLILEAKEQTPPKDIECVSAAPTGGMLRPLIAAVQLGRRTPEILAQVPLPQPGERPRHFWVQSWEQGYGELNIEDLKNQRELEEVARDAGLQLGSATSKAVPEALVEHHRFATRQALDRVAQRVPQVARSLADEIDQAWERYRAQD